MQYELLAENFVKIIGVQQSGGWVWTVTSREKTPGHVFPGMGIDEAFDRLSQHYESNINYFALAYVEAIIRLDADRVSMASEIYESIVQGLENLIMRGIEEVDARQICLPLSLDRNGITLGSARRKFDVKDFFLAPSRFREVYPNQYFFIRLK